MWISVVELVDDARNVKFAGCQGGILTRNDIELFRVYLWRKSSRLCCPQLGSVQCLHQGCLTHLIRLKFTHDKTVRAEYVVSQICW